METNDKLTKRITELELALTHLQNDYEALNDMVLQNGTRIDKLDALFKRLTDRVESQMTSESERDIEEEKPPHY